MQQIHHVFGGHVAGCALGIRAAAQAGHGRVELPHTHLQADQRVGQRLPVGVVKMPRHVVQLVMLQRRLHRALHLERRAHANRVGHADMLHADALHQSGQIGHALRRNLALIRATDGARHGPAHINALRPRRRHHRRKALNAFGNRAIDVALAESFAGRAEHHDLVGPQFARRGHRGLQPLKIGRQHRIAHARLAHNARHDFGVVGHLRHPFGRHITGDFDFCQAGVLQALHKLDLDGGGDR